MSHRPDMFLKCRNKYAVKPIPWAFIASDWNEICLCVSNEYNFKLLCNIHLYSAHQTSPKDLVSSSISYHLDTISKTSFMHFLQIEVNIQILLFKRSSYIRSIYPNIKNGKELLGPHKTKLCI